jgi:hypothetical protein
MSTFEDTSSGKFFDMYSEVAHVESRLKPTILTEVIRGFPQSLLGNAEQYLKLRHDHFPTQPE